MGDYRSYVLIVNDPGGYAEMDTHLFWSKKEAEEFAVELHNRGGKIIEAYQMWGATKIVFKPTKVVLGMSAEDDPDNRRSKGEKV